MIEQSYNIKGINFKLQNLKNISIDELVLNSFSAYHIFYLTSSKKPFLILRSNDVIDEAFITLWKSRGIQTLYALNIFSEQDQLIIKNEFALLKSHKDEFEREKCCAALLKKIEQSYFAHYSNSSLYGLVTTMREEFVQVPKEEIIQYRKVSFLIHSRSEVVATLSVLTALYLGYSDYYLLKDLFYSCYFGDVGMLNDYLDFSMIAEMKNKNSQELSLSQREILENHPQLSESKVLGSYRRHYTYPELIYLIGRHHILSKMKNNVERVSAEYTDLDLIPAFFEEVIPFEEVIYFVGDVEVVNKWINSTHFKFSLVKIIQTFFSTPNEEKEAA